MKLLGQVSFGHEKPWFEFHDFRRKKSCHFMCFTTLWLRFGLAIIKGLKVGFYSKVWIFILIGGFYEF